MKAIELAKSYDPKSFEKRLYAAWQEAGLFKPVEDPSRPPFTVVIPPPNVTGVLHMGHGLNNSIQDVLVRYHRMLGERTLWLPGTDHAGIATQHVVEKRLKKEGKSRHDLGREKFVELTWKVKEEHHAIIIEQLKRIGSSCDWSRERFTMDAGLSRAVREVFVSLYERGLLYKGEYLVNWCPSCGTALADDEVEKDDTPGAMYHIWYELVDGPCPAAPEGRIEIATTRPETLLGDTAVAVHPEDDRYRGLVGKRLRLPLTDRTIPVIADAMVDREFGTGAVKITPAHDPNDFEAGNRHGLARINILNPDGTLNDNVPVAYRGIKVQAARKAVLEDLKAAGLFKEEKKIVHAVGHCYRCSATVEPYLSEQWFVRMRPLAEKALGAWRAGELRFFPQRWENTFQHWMEGIRDWCVSRQLWWGHRIPAWYCECGETIVSRTDPDACPKCGSKRLAQDEDVLDTWFSSWLWPFSTLGWPDKTADLAAFYPTSALVTAYDIIFFWVARMVMAGMEFMGRSPFKDVYITSLVRDKQGRKMSKSLGNGIDPLEIVEEYGADALKFTIAFLTSQGQDVLVDKESFKLGSKFANKVWNATRFILLNLEGRALGDPARAGLAEPDRWIRHRLAETTEAVRAALAAYRFNDAAGAVYEFFWNDFCDWYLEASKPSMRAEDLSERDRAVTVLLDVLLRSLRLMHPFLPFVTEEIYQTLRARLPSVMLPPPAHPAYPSTEGASDWLMTAAYPEAEAGMRDPDTAARFAGLQEMVRALRNLRGELGLPVDGKLRVSLRFDSGFGGADFVRGHLGLVGSLAGALGFEEVPAKPAGAVGLPCRGLELYVHVLEAAGREQLLAKFDKEIKRERETVQRARSKLENPGFSGSAPEEVVARERAKLEEAERRAAVLERYAEELRA
jgi:valyl-tRNA synthetase